MNTTTPTTINPKSDDKKITIRNSTAEFLFFIVELGVQEIDF